MLIPRGGCRNVILSFEILINIFFVHCGQCANAENFKVGIKNILIGPKSPKVSAFVQKVLAY